MTKTKFLLLVLLVTIVGTLGLRASRAQSDTISAAVAINDGCVSTVNGSGSSNVNVTTGSSVTLTVRNDDAVVTQNISGPNVPANARVQANNKSNSGNTSVIALGVVNSPITITFTPEPSSFSDPTFTNLCPTGSSPTASQLTINTVAAPAASSSASRGATTSPSHNPSPSPTPTASSTPNQTPTTNTPTNTTPDTTSADLTNPTPTKLSSDKSSQAIGIALGVAVVLLLTGAWYVFGLKHVRSWSQFRQLFSKR